jgi:hypothetical protein
MDKTKRKPVNFYVAVVKAEIILEYDNLENYLKNLDGNPDLICEARSSYSGSSVPDKVFLGYTSDKDLLADRKKTGYCLKNSKGIVSDVKGRVYGSWEIV